MFGKSSGGILTSGMQWLACTEDSVGQCKGRTGGQEPTLVVGVGRKQTFSTCRGPRSGHAATTEYRAGISVPRPEPESGPWQ